MEAMPSLASAYRIWLVRLLGDTTKQMLTIELWVQAQLQKLVELERVRQHKYQ
jgi:hypothetical protein